MSQSLIQARSTKSKPMVADDMDLPSLVALRCPSQTCFFIRNTIDKRDGHDHDMGSDDFCWMDLALDALKPKMQPVCLWTPLAATPNLEVLRQYYPQTIPDSTRGSRRLANIEDACVRFLGDFQKDDTLQLLLSSLPITHWLHIFARETRLSRGDLRAALYELNAQNFHSVAHGYLSRAAAFEEARLDHRIWLRLFVYLSKYNTSGHLRTLLENIPNAPSPPTPSISHEHWLHAIYFTSTFGRFGNLKVLFDQSLLAVPQTAYCEAWKLAVGWANRRRRGACLRELHSIAVNCNLEPGWPHPIPLDSEEFLGMVRGGNLLGIEEGTPGAASQLSSVPK